MLPASIVHAGAREVINDLRGGGCTARRKLPALRFDNRLQLAAGRLAEGLSPQNAIDAAGYSAVQLSSIHLVGFNRDSELRQLLARQYCGLLLDSPWQEFGSVRQGSELWIVLAVPHAVPTDANAVARRVLQLVNQARAVARRCGNRAFAAAPAMQLNDTLNKAALLHARDMAQHRNMDHLGSDGSTPTQRLARLGYRWKLAGENVAAGPDSAAEVVDGWLHSSGHCANIMNPAFREMGIGFAVNHHDAYAVYWAQSFASPR